MLLGATTFAGQDGGGSSPVPYSEKKFTKSILNQTLDVPLWPAKIEFSYSESRFFQGNYPDISSVHFTARPIELIRFFEIDDANSIFYYESPANEDQTYILPSYNEYLTIYKAIISSTDELKRKVIPNLKHEIIEVFSIFYPRDNLTKILKCRIRKIERAQLIFKTSQGNFSFKRIDSYIDTEIDIKTCPEELEKFKNESGE